MEQTHIFLQTLLSDPRLWCVVGGFIAGILVMGIRILSVERRNAELEARAGAELDSRKEMENQFKVTAQEALKNAHETFLQLADINFKKAQSDGAHDLEKRQKAIDEMVKPVQKNLEELGKALEQVKGTDTALREDIKNLNRETARLVGALRDPAAQGQWGEFILEGLLDKSGLIKGLHYKTQMSLKVEDSTKVRPDAVISMQDGFNIIIDSKAPVNEFSQRLSDNLSEAEYTELTLKLARHVREHVKKLGGKNYWETMQSPDFTVMFLPSEHLYSMALRADPMLVEFAADRNVIIASPTLLMSLLRVVAMSWKQVELAKNAQEISERGVDLYKRLLAFTGHIEKIGKSLHTATRGYNEAVGSLERSVLPAARKFKDLQPAITGENFDGVGLLENTSPRLISLTTEDEDARHTLEKNPDKKQA